MGGQEFDVEADRGQCAVQAVPARAPRQGALGCDIRCPEEVLPATKGGVGAELMGTTVTVGGTRHEDCVGVDG